VSSYISPQSLANSQPSPTQNSVGFFGLLAILFIGLRLTNVIAWSWALVLAPVWAPFTLVVCAFVVIMAFQVVKAWAGW
jgi:hypothetical protein